MHARSHAEILERVLATARANNPNWQPLVLHRPEVLLQMGHEHFVLFERGFAQAFWASINNPGEEMIRQISCVHLSYDFSKFRCFPLPRPVDALADEEKSSNCIRSEGS
jgi:hypothetical protein